jgi:hypothetical protein
MCVFALRGAISAEEAIRAVSVEPNIMSIVFGCDDLRIQNYDPT